MLTNSVSCFHVKTRRRREEWHGWPRVTELSTKLLTGEKCAVCCHISHVKRHTSQIQTTAFLDEDNDFAGNVKLIAETLLCAVSF